MSYPILHDLLPYFVHHYSSWTWPSCCPSMLHALNYHFLFLKLFSQAWAHPWTVANACVSCTQAKISNLSWFLTASQRGLLALMGPDFPSEHLPLQTSYRSGTLLSYVEDKYSSGRSCKYLYRKPTWEVILTPSKQAEICGDIHRKVVKQDKWSCSQDQA